MMFQRLESRLVFGNGSSSGPGIGLASFVGGFRPKLSEARQASRVQVSSRNCGQDCTFRFCLVSAVPEAAGKRQLLDIRKRTVKALVEIPDAKFSQTWCVEHQGAPLQLKQRAARRSVAALTVAQANGRGCCQARISKQVQQRRLAHTRGPKEHDRLTRSKSRSQGLHAPDVLRAHRMHGGADGDAGDLGDALGSRLSALASSASMDRSALPFSRVVM
jgi:hypothetical protein